MLQNINMEEELWQQYDTEWSEERRQSLIEFYLPYAKKLALGIYKKWVSSEICVEDFFQFSTLGLIEAIDSYQYDKGVPFKAYARFRIKGSVLNSISKYSENLSFSSYNRKIEKDRLDSLVNLVDSQKLEDFDRFVTLTVGGAYIEILDDIGVDDESQIFATPYEQPLEAAIGNQLLVFVSKLDEKYRRVIELHYLEGFTFAEAARYLKLSKSTISLYHAKAIFQLKQLQSGYSRLEQKI